MLYIVLHIIIILLALVGLTEVCRGIVLFFIKPKEKNTCFVVVPVKGNRENIECVLRSAAARIHWTDSSAPQHIICLDCGADEETASLCKKICSDYSFMFYITKEDFSTDSFFSESFD